MSTSHRRPPAAPDRIEVLRHLAAALDEEDVHLLAGVAQATADQIRAMDRLLNPVQDDFRLKAERLDHLSQLLARTNHDRPVLAAWGVLECAYCGLDVDNPVRRRGRLYCDDTCAMAAS